MYYYLVHTLILGLLWLILFLYRKDLKHEMIISSLLFMPFGITQPLFVPDYYNPPVIYKFFGLFDVESLLWCFFIGGISAVIYKEIFRYYLRKNRSNRNMRAKRYHAYVIYLSLILIALGMLLVYFFTEFSVLRVSFLLVLPVIVYMLYTRFDLIKESLTSGVLMMLLYIGNLYFLGFLFPGFHLSWTETGLWGIRFFNLPVEEFIFGFLLGMGWSVIYEEIENIKLKKAR